MGDIVSLNTDPESVQDAARSYFQAMPTAARSIGVHMDPDGSPNLEDLRAATRDRIIIRLREISGSE
jgi:hypothetical protein